VKKKVGFENNERKYIFTLIADELTVQTAYEFELKGLFMSNNW